MSTIKLLIADDEPMIREGLRDMLESFELNVNIVGEAKNGKEALHLSKTLEPDIILTDICMPKLSGLDFIHELRQVVHNRAHIIIISGFNEFEYARQAISLGVKDYLLKPIQEEELKASIKKCSPEILEIADENKKELCIHFIDECLVFLKNNFENKDINLKAVAIELSVNPDYLSHKLKKETGYTFKEWLNKIRIKKAAELLETKQYTVGEVAEIVGYANQHYFSTVFKQYTGKSPKNH